MMHRYTKTTLLAVTLVLLSSLRLLAQDNLVANGEFDQGFDNWQEFTNAGDFSTEVVTTDSISGENALRATIADPGPDPFSLGIRQFVATPAQVDTVYSVTFQAKADTNRTMVVELKLGEETRLYETVPLSPEVDTYRFTTTATVAGPISLGFFMGTESPGIVLDDVRLTTGELPPVEEDPEVIANGEFDDGLSGWVELSNDGGDLTPTVVSDAALSGDNALRAVIDVPGPNSFSTGILQNISRPAKVDYRYTITFQARAEADRKLTVQYIIDGDSKIFTEVQLTSEPQNYRLVVSSDQVGPMQLLFFMGVEAPTIYLDAVSVQEQEIVPEPDIPLGGTAADYDLVAIGGGGYVTGVYYHPTTPNLLYMRTDVGGSFRYDYDTRQWIPLFTDFTLEEENYFGTNALALAPSDDRYVYVSTGKSEFFNDNKDVLVSKDRGQTWETTGLNKELFASGGFFAKIIGPALAVDPTDATKVYAGTVNDGLWYKGSDSTDWVRVEGIPNGAANLGVKAIVFAPNGDLFVGLPEVGVFRRRNGSTTSEAIEGAPTEIYKLTVNSQSHLYAATGDGVEVYRDSTWTTELAGRVISGVDVHPADDNRIVAIETRFGSDIGEIYSTVDGGSNWKTIVPRSDDYRRKKFPRWYPDFFWVNAPSSITFDPSRTDAVAYADFFAVWHTNNIQKDVSVWNTYSRGHEETYVTDLVSPTEGPRLMSGLADALGFQWDERLDRFPKTTLIEQEVPVGAEGWVNNGTSLDFCEGQPEEKVFAANVNNFGGQGYLFRTRDNFQTWTQREVPGSMGRVAMSATTPENMVIVTQGEESKVFYTEDDGLTWKPSQGAPEGIIDNMFRSRKPLTADRVAGNTFYLYVNPSEFYRSTDGGKSFRLVNQNLPGFGTFDKWEAQARPDAENEVWVGLDNAGLYRSVDGGATFQRIPGVKRAYTFGFGKGKGLDDPAVVYVLGQINDVEGIFFSTDSGQTWNQVETGINWVNGPRSLTGDRQRYGQLYVGSNGSGILTLTLEDAGEEEVAPETLEQLEVRGIHAYPNTLM